MVKLHWAGDSGEPLEFPRLRGERRECYWDLGEESSCKRRLPSRAW